MTPPKITIVSGVPRSGTSLMMQMLQAGGMPVLTDHARAPDPDNPRGYFEFEPVKYTRNDPSWLSAAEGKVVKMVHLLLYDLPTDRSYKLVLMRRDLREVVESQRKMLKRQNRPGAALPDEKLIEVFDQALRKLTAWLATQRQFEVLEVNYNALLADPIPVVRKLNAFFGGGLSEARMLEAVDPGLYRNRA
ncbi:MAG: sulfotransferase [Phycisphaerae bacterium]|nr:sulfotransferase [Phycisphaerae bacterium]MDW8261852.1 sulfotransferase domain-containing protein [Phycisphaerales bacterium]